MQHLASPLVTLHGPLTNGLVAASSFLLIQFRDILFTANSFYKK